MMLSTPQRDALLALADAHGGRLTPQIVVDAARDPSSPLHDVFTWDDAAAAEAHRLAQARVLLRRVRVEIETPQRLVRVPYFTRDPAAAPSEQGYVSLGRLKSDHEAARDALAAAFGRAARALQDARDLAEALGLGGEVENLRGQVLGLRDRIAHGTARA